MLLTKNKLEVYNELYFDFLEPKFNNFEFFKKFKTSLINPDIKLSDIKITFLHLGKNDCRMKASDIIDIMKNMDNKTISRYDYFEKILNEMAIPYLNVDDVTKVKFAEVFTPIWLIDEQLDNCFPKTDWSNPNLTWLDASNGIGNYLIRIIQRLLIGLANVEGFEDEEVRYRHIIEKMVYACEIQPINMFSYIFFIDPKGEYNTNFYRGDYLNPLFNLNMRDNWKLISFDRILGNPPYHIKDNGAKASSKPIYNKFIEQSINISNKNTIISFITPSRWFAGGKGLDTFRKMMMESNKLSCIKHFDDASTVFGEVDIKGGVSYFSYDNSFSGKCDFNGINVNLNKFDVIVSNTSSMMLISKLLEMESIADIHHARSYFKISTNDSRLVDTQLNDNYALCYVAQQKGFTKWIDKTDLKVSNTWRVVTPRAATKGGCGFGNIFISKPGEYLNDTYLSFFVKSENEAKSLASYLRTKFANYLLSLRKVSQDISNGTIKWIPKVSFDREWNDELLFKYFNLTEEEINLIIEADLEKKVVKKKRIKNDYSRAL